MTKDKKVTPENWYTMQDIVRDEMFPWHKSFWSVRKAVIADKANGNILQAVITGRSRGKKYHFKGENIIKFIKLIEKK